MLTDTKKFSDEINFSDDAPLAPLVPMTPNLPATARQAIPIKRTEWRDLGASQQKAEIDRANMGLAPEVCAPPQDVERVSVAGAARATADEALAKSLGFSPKPPVYEIGTTVNSIGVENFTRSRTEWSALPSIPELARAFSDRVRREERSDVLVDATSCSMSDDGIFHAGPERSFMTSERAMHGLATHITPGGASYLKECPTALRAQNLNHWLGQAFQVDARATKKASGREVTKPKQLTLRTRARKIGGREVFAVVGPKYAAFDVDRVAREAAAGIGGDARGTVTYDGYKMTMDAMFHSNVKPENAVAGEFFKGVIRIQAADDGTGSIRAKLGLWRNLCRNLIIVDFDQILIGSRKHIGQTTIEADVRALVKQANERIGLIVGKWGEASTEMILDRYDLQDVDQVFEGLVLNGAVHVSGVKNEDMVKRLHESWEREPGYTKTAILNAITRAAHEHTWDSWEASEELESTAGRLLYQPVWNLNTEDRTAEEILA